MRNRLIKDTISATMMRPHGRIVLVTGARQTGKTTLLRNLLPDFQYISFDDPFVRSQFASMSARDLATRYPKAILDEVQKAPSMFDVVKAAYDADGNCRFALSGSSQILMMQRVRETLAGRVAIFEMSPLLLTECRTEDWNSPVPVSRWMSLLADPRAPGDLLAGTTALDSDFPRQRICWERYLDVGAMPLLWNDQANLSIAECRQWLADYSRTYLQRDLRDLVMLRDLDPFVLAQKALALQTGGILSLANIARDAAIAPSTASRFIRYLEQSYQIIVLRPWFANPQKRLVKSPKIHFADPGILRSVTGYEGTLPGNAFESAVVAELVKQMPFAKTNAEAFFLRTADGLEVDLLVSLPQGYIAIEIKHATAVSRHDARHLLAIDSILDKPVLCRMVVSNSPHVLQFTPDTFAIPAAWLLG